MEGAGGGEVTVILGTGRTGRQEQVTSMAATEHSRKAAANGMSGARGERTGSVLQGLGWSKAVKRKQEPDTREEVTGTPILLLAFYSVLADPGSQDRKHERHEINL